MCYTAAMSSGGDYRIEVTDFGPIAHADVDLRPLTVFAGPSNTGKSYLAMLVYALHRFFGSSQRATFRLAPFPYRIASSVVHSLPDRETLASQIAEWKSAGGSAALAPLPDDLAGPLRRALERHEVDGESLSQEVSRCFGAELTDLVRRESGERTTRIMLRVPAADSDPVRYRFEFGQARTRFFGQVPAVPLFVSEDYRGRPVSSEDDLFLLQDVLGAAVRRLIGPIVRSAYYLPADRTGVMHSHQVVVSTLIQSAATAGLRPSTNVPMLSGVLADFLDGLVRMSSGRRSRRAEKMPRALETNLLSGTIRLQESETGYPSFAYRPVDWDTELPLMRTSSMVSELAPVVLYLRYFVRAGDVLIIEEPESHLHPAMQAVFARELARLVGSGVRVMLTTHSEWMLEALANLVRLAELPARERTGITGADVALAADQVGAWMFKRGADGTGSTVEEIPLDTEAGSFPAGYGEITESLYNDWAKIANPNRRVPEQRHVSSALTTVDQRIDSGCLVSEMVKGGCTVGTADAPAPFRIVDLDHAAAPVRPNASKCDYLFLAEADGGFGIVSTPS